MAILGTNDGGSASLEDIIASLTDQVTTLTSQLDNYNTGSLEGSQSIDALNDRIGLYRKAIDEYTKVLGQIKSGGDAAKRGSALKQQAKQGYITGVASSKGHTRAEALKDMADIEGIGRAERADIQSQTDANLVSATGGLSNIYMDAAEQQATIDAQKAASSGSGSGSGGLSAEMQAILDEYNKDKEDDNKATEQDVKDITEGKKAEYNPELAGLISKIGNYPGIPLVDIKSIFGVVNQGYVPENIFKKLPNK